MRRFLYLLVASCVLLTCSCEWLAGVKRDPETGEVISVADNPIVSIGTSLLYALGGGGAVAGGAIGYAIKAYRRREIIKSGGKDDNFDGIPDLKPPTPTPGSTV